MSNPSAGTARPDAAPSDDVLLEELENAAVFWGNCTTDEDLEFAREECAEKRGLVSRRLAALRSSLAEREAECERLRSLLEQYDIMGALERSLDSRAGTDGNPAVTNEQLAEFARKIREGWSTAVAPAARETQETTE